MELDAGLSDEEVPETGGSTGTLVVVLLAKDQDGGAGIGAVGASAEVRILGGMEWGCFRLHGRISGSQGLESTKHMMG
jgi:hypothetical protein